MNADAVAGPSAGVTGGASTETWPDDLLRDHPDLIRAVMTSGRVPRAGHDRQRWEAICWDDYRAQVGIGGRAGPWRVTVAEEKPGTTGQWITEADGMPFVPGWYTALIHDERGLVMSDVPAEIAGCLPFLDAVATWQDTDPEANTVLVSGLGLGIVPAWLLARAAVSRVDVTEIDPDVTRLVVLEESARREWAADSRLHVHHGDALTWQLPVRSGCVLHPACPPPLRFDAAWHDIWDQPSALNLPSMHRLHRRYGRWCGWQMSWERPECEAQRRRGPRDGLGCLCAIPGEGAS